MAKPGNKVNQSQAIRDMLGQHPKASVNEIIELLAQKKIVVKPNLVYFVKGRMAQMKSQRKRKAARVANVSQKTGIIDPVALILKVKQLAKEAGGLNRLGALISALTE
jgi:hypothetical protein